MFGMGFTEILLIAVIAILFLGPDKLPNAMVQVAKFIKGAKKAITEAKTAIDNEVKISDLKEEAMGYKAQLDAATDTLQGFKNINPVNDLNDALASAKNSFESTSLEAITTPVEPKQNEDMIQSIKSKDEKGNA
ncbi:MAG TPA: Sec-independent protein translocase subunit TatB [Campylobacterales bacterium]|nr:Sec-independent protein translocase subunit TatB [Campylobacterales bacterium]